MNDGIKVDNFDGISVGCSEGVVVQGHRQSIFDYIQTCVELIAHQWRRNVKDEMIASDWDQSSDSFSFICRFEKRYSTIRLGSI